MSNYNEEILNHYGIEKTAASETFRVIVNNARGAGIRVAFYASVGVDVNSNGGYSGLSRKIQSVGDTITANIRGAMDAMEKQVLASFPGSKVNVQKDSTVSISASDKNILNLSSIGNTFFVTGKGVTSASVGDAIEPLAKRLRFELLLRR